MPKVDYPLPPPLGPVMLLADHLDATLALAEDLSRLTLPAVSAADVLVGSGARSGAVVAYAQSARALELAITARVIQARRRATELSDMPQDIARLVNLFIGGTAVVADAVQTDGAGLGETSAVALSTGPAALRFLKSRSVVAADLAVMDDVGALVVGEDYLAAGLLHLGTLMDMVASFLAALDHGFEIFGPKAAA